jgi:hypothetical protein
MAGGYARRVLLEKILSSGRYSLRPDSAGRSAEVPSSGRVAAFD